MGAAGSAEDYDDDDDPRYHNNRGNYNNRRQYPPQDFLDDDRSEVSRRYDDETSSFYSGTTAQDTNNWGYTSSNGGGMMLEDDDYLDDGTSVAGTSVAGTSVAPTSVTATSVVGVSLISGHGRHQDAFEDSDVSSRRTRGSETNGHRPEPGNGQAAPSEPPRGGKSKGDGKKGSPLSPIGEKQLALPSEPMDGVLPSPKSESMERGVSDAGSAAVKGTKSGSIGQDMDHDDVVKKLRETKGAVSKGLRPAMHNAEHLEDTLIEKEDLIQYLTESISRRKELVHLIFALVYFVTFMCLLMTHEDLGDVSQVERYFRARIEGSNWEETEDNMFDLNFHNTFLDIQILPDFWNYVRGVAGDHLPELAETEPEHISRMLRYNKLVGGIQMQQVRRKMVPCDEAYPELGPKDEFGNNPFLLDFNCFPIESVSAECFGPGQEVDGFCPESFQSNATSEAESAEAEAPLRRLSRVTGAADARWSRASAAQVRVIKGDRGSSGELFSLTLHEFEGAEHAVERTRVLEDNNWIDEQTMWVGVTLSAVNPDLGIFTTISANLLFPPSGEIIPLVSASTFAMEPYDWQYTIFLDFWWLFLWIVQLLQCIFSFANAMRKGLEGRYYYVRQARTYMGWLSTVCGAGAMLMWYFALVQLAAVKQALMEVSLNRPALAEGTDPAVMKTYTTSLTHLQEEVAALEDLAAVFRPYLCGYAIVLMFMLFKAFDGQPKLAVLTNTLHRSWEDLAHWGIIFVTVFVSFTCAGMFLLGHRMIEFSSIGMATEVCLQMLFGAFDLYPEMMNHDPFTFFVWFLLFIVLIFMVLINMMLAIVIEVYTAVRNEAATKEAMWEQVYNLISSFANRKDLMQDWVMLGQVETMNKELLSKTYLREQMPHLGEKQANFIIQAVIAQEEAEEEEGLDLSDTLGLMVDIQSEVQILQTGIDELIGLQQVVGGHVKKAMQHSGMHGGAGMPKMVRLHPAFEKRIRTLELRLDKIEEFMNEAMSYMVFRGKQARDTLKSVEDGLRRQRDGSSGTSSRRPRSRRRSGSRSRSEDGDRGEPASPRRGRHASKSSPAPAVKVGRTVTMNA